MSKSTPPPTSPNNPTGPMGATYACEVCNTAYYSREDLELHNKQTHPDRKVEEV